MMYIPDDVDQNSSELMGLMNDPLINSEIMNMAGVAGYYGVDLENPEMMAGFLQDIYKKVKSAITGGTTIQVTTDKGQVKVGGGEVSVSTEKPIVPVVPVPVEPGGIMDLLKNKWILGTIIGVPILLILLNRMKKDKKEE